MAPVFDSPENHGLEYEDVTFKAEDGVTLFGWLINGTPTRSLPNLTSRCNPLVADSPSKGRAQEHIHHFVVNKTKKQLLNCNNTVGRIAYSPGFEYPQHFSRMFKAKTGMSPGQFRKAN